MEIKLPRMTGAGEPIRDPGPKRAGDRLRFVPAGKDCPTRCDPMSQRQLV